MKLKCAKTLKHILMVSIAFLLLVNLFVTPVSAWWNTDWQYRQSINITNEGNNLTNYPVNIIIDTRTLVLNNTLNANGSDIRFIDSDDTTLLPFWNETSYNKSRTKVWVNVTSLPNTSTTTIYMYYGNLSAVDVSNPEATFYLFDNFEGTAGSVPNSTLWTVEKMGSTSAIVELDGNGNLRLAGEPYATSSGNIRSKINFTNGVAVRLRHSIDDEHYVDVSFGNGSVQGEQGNSSWWHTNIGDGYSYFWQSPISGDSTNDIAIQMQPEGAPNSILAGDNKNELTRINENLTFEYTYNTTGNLGFYGSNNWRTQLKTPTYDGSGQTVHPDIYYNLSGWNGYKYWMAITPYPASNDTYENPSILVSNNGGIWMEPTGITNPIDPAPATGHGSDPDIVYNQSNNKLYVYYRWSDGTYDTIKMRNSSDGIMWGDELEILNSTTISYVSPAIIIENNTYYMWFVDILNSPNTLELYTSENGTVFTPNTTATLDFTPDPSGAGIGGDLWHVNVRKVGSEYYGMFTFCDLGVSGTNATLYFANSTNKINWTVQRQVLLSADTPAPATSWDDCLIYRTTMLYSAPRLRIWYSARSHINKWHLGYIEAEKQNDNWTAVEGEVMQKWLEVTNSTYLHSNDKNILLSQGEHQTGLGGNRYIDWIVVRKYQDPEPIASSGAEQANAGAPVTPSYATSHPLTNSFETSLSLAGILVLIAIVIGIFSMLAMIFSPTSKMDFWAVGTAAVSVIVLLALLYIAIMLCNSIANA